MLHRLGSRRAAAGTSIDLIGVPTDAGASCRGSRMGPAALRIAGIAERLERLGYTVGECGDLSVGRGLGAAREVDALARLGSAAGYQSLAAGARPLFLGGDHSLSMGSVAGVARHCREAGRELFVLWLDAHGDFNTPTTTETGNIHGMSLALLCGEPEFTTDPSWYAPVDPRNATVFGARSLDRAEKALLARRGVEVIDMRAIHEEGVVAPLRRVLQRVDAADGHLHLSLDVDAMDPAIAPGVGTAVPDGLTLGEAHLIMKLLHESGRVGSLDLVELNPLLDHAGMSARLLVDLTASLFGETALAIRQPRAGRVLHAAA